MKDEHNIYPGGQIPGWPSMRDCCELKDDCFHSCHCSWVCPLAEQERWNRVYDKIIPKELQIGDLLFNRDNWICIVLEIKKDGVTVFAREKRETNYKWEEVRPIKLTEEIILKLGWEELSSDDKNYVRGMTSGKQYKHPDYTNTLNIRENALTNLYWIIDGEINIKHLHDLQHVLRQTVKDEIQLEKLEELYHEKV
jgi:hypothetical protein